ncbi:sensor histidine kinase [Saccharopolyspora rosea]|uniref:sensor histidine kinase n=1 Tax=Saccharopolyspora rosea TaxID=524884 RepID=UPI0021D8C6A1|nr:ATP-binding protein [Saccharopolyspora rosea]
MTRKSSPGSEYRPIRARLTRVVIVPGVVVLVIWAAFTGYAAYRGYSARTIATGVRDATAPAVRGLGALQEERRLAMQHGDADPGVVSARRAETDRAVRDVRAELRRLGERAPARVADRAGQLDGLLAQLPAQRAALDSGNLDRRAAFAYYNRLLDAGVALLDAQARAVPDPESGRAGLVATDLVRAADQMSRASSLGGAALADGGFTAADHVTFASLVGAYHSTLDTSVPVAEPSAARQYARLSEDPAWQRLQGYETALVEHSPRVGGPFEIAVADWRSATEDVSQGLTSVAAEQATGGAELGVRNSDIGLVRIAVGSLVALLVALLGLLLAVRSARKIVDRALVSRLSALRGDALELAERRLPDIAARLADGEQVDVAGERGRLDYGDDEVGQVADAFNTAYRAAVGAAVRENQAREGANRVFLGIAHRNQGLVHRQLKQLDRMERNEEHPERLDGLFQLDHLATRARRNAENLIILAGEQPGRQWRKPVRLVDVVRAAVAETEQYYRIVVNPVPEVSLVGAAVGDAIHLLAELMDNATSFSPPQSQVQVHAVATPRGVDLRIDDEGLGMRPEDRDSMNELLASAPRFEDITLGGDARLGLFVVARLAHRRDVVVSLRDGADGGTSAHVRLPADIVVGEAESTPAPPRPEPEREPVAAAPPPEMQEAWSRLREQLPLDAANAAPAAPPADDTPTIADPGFPAVDPDGGPPLPRRRRRENLPPQLRDGQRDEAEREPDEAGRVAERTRGNMAAFQRGTLRARRTETSTDGDSLAGEEEGQ